MLSDWLKEPRDRAVLKPCLVIMLKHTLKDLVVILEYSRVPSRDNVPMAVIQLV